MENLLKNQLLQPATVTPVGKLVKKEVHLLVRHISQQLSRILAVAYQIEQIQTSLLPLHQSSLPPTLRLIVGQYFMEHLQNTLNPILYHYPFQQPSHKHTVPKMMKYFKILPKQQRLIHTLLCQCLIMDQLQTSLFRYHYSSHPTCLRLKQVVQNLTKHLNHSPIPYSHSSHRPGLKQTVPKMMK